MLSTLSFILLTIGLASAALKALTVDQAWAELPHGTNDSQLCMFYLYYENSAIIIRVFVSQKN